jgi:hypothetical protein
MRVPFVLRAGRRDHPRGRVAALEAMMELRELAGDRMRVWLVAAWEDFVERPMSVAGPFGLGAVRCYPLGEIAADFGAEFVHASAIGVDAREPRLVFADGATLAGSTLILAPGARTLVPFPEAVAFGIGDSGESVREFVGALGGRVPTATHKHALGLYGRKGVNSFERQAGSSGLVLGRKTYEGLAGYWPGPSARGPTWSTRCRSTSAPRH